MSQYIPYPAVPVQPVPPTWNSKKTMNVVYILALITLLGTHTWISSENMIRIHNNEKVEEDEFNLKYKDWTQVFDCDYSNLTANVSVGHTTGEYDVTFQFPDKYQNFTGLFKFECKGTDSCFEMSLTHTESCFIKKGLRKLPDEITVLLKDPKKKMKEQDGYVMYILYFVLFCPISVLLLFMFIMHMTDFKYSIKEILKPLALIMLGVFTLIDMIVYATVPEKNM